MQEQSPADGEQQQQLPPFEQSSPYGAGSEFPTLNDSTTTNAQAQEHPYPGDELLLAMGEGDGEVPNVPMHRKQSLFRAQGSEGSMGKSG